MKFGLQAVPAILWLSFLSSGAFAQTPVIDPNRVQSSATADSGPLAPGSLVTIYGINFASGNTTWNTVPLAPMLDNVTVTVAGTTAPLSGVYHDPVNGDQINAQIPWDAMAVVPPGTTGIANLIVRRNGVASAAVPIRIAAAAPGIFAVQLNKQGVVIGTGTGQAIAYGNLDGLLAAPEGAIAGLTTRPYQVSDPQTLQILATGLGSATPAVKTGDVGGTPNFSYTDIKPEVLVGGVRANVLFALISPYFVGVYQINIQLDPDTPTGPAIPLQIRMNGVTSTNKVTIAVR